MVVGSSKSGRRHLEEALEQRLESVVAAVESSQAGCAEVAVDMPYWLHTDCQVQAGVD